MRVLFSPFAGAQPGRAASKPAGLDIGGYAGEYLINFLTM
jgi:hypothetical protein